MDRHIDNTINQSQREFESELEAVRERLRRNPSPGEDGIRIAKLTRGDSPMAKWLLSVDADRASLFGLLRRLDLDYLVADDQLDPLVSARFQERPLEDALGILSRSTGQRLRLEDDLVVVESLPASNQGVLFREYGLRHVDVELANEMLKRVFLDDDEQDADSFDEDYGAMTKEEEDEAEDEGDRGYGLYREAEEAAIAEGVRGDGLAFLMRRETNSIYLYGRADRVNQAAAILGRLDREPQHILIEAKVVEFDSIALKNVGAKLAGQGGEYSNANIDFGNILGETISFTRTADDALSEIFTASINMLLQTNQAKVLAKPYLITVSGKKAYMEVTEDRFLTVRNGEDVDLEEVSGGVIFDINPVASGDGSKIRLDMKVTISVFGLEQGMSGLSRDRGTFKSSSLVSSGETIIIGGMMWDNVFQSRGGIPYLQDIPVLDLAFSNQIAGKRRMQTIIYLTPYIWEHPRGGEAASAIYGLHQARQKR
jgi:type II secretory pathway component GspD/PulD (secretin)